MQFPAVTEKGKELAPLIDHTLLRADSVRSRVELLCREARHYGFASVCVIPSMVRLASEQLTDSHVKISTVIGFPLGVTTTRSKAFEAEDAVNNGANELDMVLAIAALKDRDYQYVLNDIKAVVNAAGDRIVKVILETFLLSDEEKVSACKLATEAGARFVKTSTGFAGGGATVEDVRLMRRSVPSGVGVKASGGIRTLTDALRMVEAGANRLGTSSGGTIVTATS